MTSISLDALDRKDLPTRFGPDAVPLFLVEEDGTLTFVHGDEELPSVGELFLLAPCRSSERPP